MKYQVTGRIHSIMPVKQVSERFSRRDFVIETDSDSRYPQLVSFQATGKLMDELDNVNEGDTVEVSFELKGRKWDSPSGETKYFNTLDAFRMDHIGASRASAANADDTTF